MSFHLVGFDSSIPNGSILTKVNALQSNWETIQNNNLIVGLLNLIIGAWAGGSNIVRAQIQEPVLISPGYPDIRPVDKLQPVNQYEPLWRDLTDAPIALKTLEQLVAMTANGGAGAENEIVALLMADKPPQPKTGKIFTLKLTGATTLTAHQWTSVPLTFEDNLPIGNYSLVGARFESAGVILARIGFPGFPWRPGTLGVQNGSARGVELARYGGWGEWFSFNSTAQLTADFLSGSADTSETVYVDLIGPS